MTPPNSTSWVPMAQGLGKMNSDTLKAEQMICHSSTMATRRIQGDQRSAVFLCMGVCFGFRA